MRPDPYNHEVRQAAATPAGLAEVSGISDAAAPGAIGKLICSSVTGALRDRPPRFQMLAPLLLQVPANARIYVERSGTGHVFHRLKYRSRDPVTGRSSVTSAYIGVLSDGELLWARAILAERFASRGDGRISSAPLAGARIRALMKLFKLAHAEARRVAPRAGFSFHGYRLMRRKP